MNSIFQRTEKMIGSLGMDKLSRSTVAVFGLGGVGSAACEALVRAGIGHLIIVDHDTVNPSNINRQISATHSTVGQFKVEAQALRIHEINPMCQVTKYPIYFKSGTQIDLGLVDYILDCIDSVDSKVALIDTADICKIPIISSMGAANRIKADFEVADIYQTTGCPLAKVMRSRLREIGIQSLKVVYSPTKPYTNATNPLSSISFVPPVAGYMMAGEVVRDLLNIKI